LNPLISCSLILAYTPHMLLSSPWASALDHRKGLSAEVQSRLGPCPQ